MEIKIKDIVKVVDLGHGITKTVIRRFLRTDERGRDIYGDKITNYERNGVTVCCVEFPGYSSYGLDNARVFVVGGKQRERSFKDKSNANDTAYKMLIELTS